MLQIQCNPILMRASSDVDGVLPFLLSCDDVNVAVVWSLSLLTKMLAVTKGKKTLSVIDSPHTESNHGPLHY